MSDPQQLSAAQGQGPWHDAALQVLLLEDSRFDAELLRESLRTHYPRATLQVVQDEDGFVAALAPGGCDLVLSDYEVPGFGGLQALQYARALAPRVPFVFVSGVIGEDNAVEMLKQGATDYVSKSRLARLPVVIDRALREVAGREARDRAEAQLREADAVFARVVDSLRDYAVVLLDADGRIRHWNRGAREVFGYERSEVLGLSGALLFTPEDRAADVFGRELRTALQRGRAPDDRWMQRADGSRLWAEGVVAPLHSAAGVHNGFCKVLRDATGAHTHASALRAAKEDAERANLAKDRFLGMLSHELRTPLSPIASAARVLEQHAEVPGRFAGLLPMIRRNVALEARLIDDLLDLTAITAGKMTLKPAPVDMHALLQVVVEMVAESLHAKRLELVQCLDAPHAVVEADQARMQQVLWNIVRNAIKFTSEEGRITLATSNAGGCWVLRCTDTGIGIQPQALPRIFIAFEQADAEVSHRFGGLGLGLAIARGLVAEHEGRLVAESEGTGRGATFTLELPSFEATAPAQDDLQAPAALVRATGVPHHLLLVEDNADAAEALSLSLEMQGYRVTHVASCAAALERAERESFDVIVTDLGLPDGSGIDVGRRLGGQLPVIALSGYGTQQDLQRSRAAGFAGHLVKPADPDTVHALVQQVLNCRPPVSVG